MRNQDPILTPFTAVGRGPHPTEVAILTHKGHVALIEIVQAAFKESTNCMAIRAEWRVLHLTNSQGDIYQKDLPKETAMVARTGSTISSHTHGAPHFMVTARREAVAAAREFLGIKAELHIVGDDLEEEAATG